MKSKNKSPINVMYYLKGHVGLVVKLIMNTILLMIS